MALRSGKCLISPEERTWVQDRVARTPLTRNRQSLTAGNPFVQHWDYIPGVAGLSLDASWPTVHTAHTQQFPGSGTSPCFCLHFVLVFNWLADVRLLAFVFPQEHCKIIIIKEINHHPVTTSFYLPPGPPSSLWLTSISPLIPTPCTQSKGSSNMCGLTHKAGQSLGSNPQQITCGTHGNARRMPWATVSCRLSGW